jgi:L-ascorbate metabolism protein UlaG (beta-lactamase superfamily)
VDAVLITHNHYDHCDANVVRAAVDRSIPVWAPADARDAFDERVRGCVRVAEAGDRFRVGDISVEVLGERHAEIHPDIAGPLNRAYLLDDSVLVTGDEHPTNFRAVTALVTPVDAPWLRASDLIRYVRQVRPRTVIGVHDGLVNEHGEQVADAVLRSLCAEGAGEAVRLAVGESYRVDAGVDARR